MNQTRNQTGNQTGTQTENHTGKIRFGLQVMPDPAEVAEVGANAEAAGFDVLTVSDHIGPGRLAPLPTLAAVAAATDTIRLGTMVLNNDMRNPVQLAWDCLALQRLSGGRFELGIGAGHTPQEYRWTGIGFDKPAVRKERLAESVEILGGLFRGESVTHAGAHYQIDEGCLLDGDGDGDEEVTPPPILVGGNGTSLLTHAANHCQMIGLQGLAKTKADGHRHHVKFSIGHLEAQLATIDDALPPGAERPELNALLQAVTITDDREAAAAAVAERVDGLTVADALATPYLAFGTVDELVDQFVAARDRWGISYFTVRDPALAPVIAGVRARDAG